MDKRHKYRITAFIVFISVICIIFYFTGKTGEESDEASMTISRIVEGFVDKYFYIDSDDVFWTDTLNAIIRKIGHFLEFSLLGAASGAFFILSIKRKRVSALVSFSICTSIALLDEFRQKFISGRSPRWFDVQIDIMGSLFGIAIVFFIYLAYSEIKRMKNRIKLLEGKIKSEI